MKHTDWMEMGGDLTLDAQLVISHHMQLAREAWNMVLQQIEDDSHPKTRAKYSIAVSSKQAWDLAWEAAELWEEGCFNEVLERLDIAAQLDDLVIGVGPEFALAAKFRLEVMVKKGVGG